MKSRQLIIAAIITMAGNWSWLNECAAEDMVENELLSLYGSEEFISIATGHIQPINKAPAVASIITSQAIKQMGVQDIDEVLESLPGLHVARNHQGYNPIYTFRGIYSDLNPQVLMLIDGVPISNLFTGNRTNVWGGLPVEMVERVEVIRGPGSAIYGADAFAGVINIITKTGNRGGGLEVGGSFGSYNTKNAFINYGKKYLDSNLGLYVQVISTDGANEIIDSDSQSFLDLLTGTSSSLAPSGANLGRQIVQFMGSYDYKKLKINVNYHEVEDGETGAGIIQTLDSFGQFNGKRFLANVRYESLPITDSINVDIVGNFLKTSQEVEKDIILYPPGTTGPFFSPLGQPLFPIFVNGVIGNPEVYETHSRLDATFHISAIENHNMTLGVGYYYGDVYKTKEEKNYCTDLPSCSYILPRLLTNRLVDVSDTPYLFLQEGDRDNRHIYLQDVFRLGNDWELTAGVRYDDYSDFGDTVNPRLALVWSTTNRLTTKFLYGEAFRAPVFVETRNINNPLALGNPDLKPETLKSYELVFDYNPINGLKYVINTFYYQWDDIIQFVPDNVGPTSTAQNAGEQTGYGLEAEIQWEPSSSLDILANIAFQKSTDEKTDRDAADSPQKQVYLQANWEFLPDYNLNLQGNWVMDRARELGDPRSDIDDYVTVDLSLRRFNLFRDLELAVHLKNVFDEDAREPSPSGFPPAIPHDLPLAGRRVIGEIRYNF